MLITTHTHTLKDSSSFVPLRLQKKKAMKEEKPLPIILDISCCSPTVTNISCPCCWILLSPAFYNTVSTSDQTKFVWKKKEFITCVLVLTIHTKRRIWIFLNWSELCSSLGIFLLDLFLCFGSYHTSSNQCPVKIHHNKKTQLQDWFQK